MKARRQHNRDTGLPREIHRGVCFAGCLWVSLLLPLPGLGDEAMSHPEKQARFDLAVRRPGEKDVTKATRRVPVEVFLDRKANCLVYVAEAGKGLAVVPAGKTGREQAGKPPTWLYRLTLPVRGWDEKDLGMSTPKVGLEVHRDEANDALIYMSDTGAIAVVRGPVVPADKRDKEPRWLGRLPLRVRPSSENEKGFRHCNVEVYQDRNAGRVVYVSAKGTLGVHPEITAANDRKDDQPVLSHGLTLRARTYEEDSFTGAAKFGVEVYRDERRSVWVYLSETFHLAVVPGGKPPEFKRLKAPAWERALAPRASAGSKWSAEGFLNPNNGHQLFVTASGALAILAGPFQKD